MRLKRLGLLGLVLLPVLGLAFLFSWPLWATGIARDKAQARLDARFENVNMEAFSLARDHALIQGLTFQERGLDVRLEEVRVDFHVSWKGDVEILGVLASGGTAAGTWTSEKAQAKTTTASESPTYVVNVADVAIDIAHEDSMVQGNVTASIAGDSVELELHDGRFEHSGRSVAFASLSTQVDRANPFPLTAQIQKASVAVIGDSVVSGITGTVTVKEREALHITLDLHGDGPEDNTTWAMKGFVDREMGSGEIEVRSDPFEMGFLGQDFVRSLPGEIAPTSKIYASGVVQWAAGRYWFEGMLGVKDASFYHPMVALDRVEGINFQAAVLAMAHPVERRISLDMFELSIAETTLIGKLTVLDGDERSLSFQVSMPETDCQKVLQAIPKDLVPGLSGFKLEGTMAIDLTVNIDPARPDDTVLEGEIGIDRCKLKEIPEEVARLDGPFIHEVRRKDGAVQRVDIMANSGQFTPYDQIASTVSAAVLTTEDGGFWKHNGFLPSQFKAALRRNVEVGKIRRGASTLTMQMVKNALLSHERTLSRKIQELFLTWVVEQKLTKKRILEIYLNIVEFGPGIYGITSASWYYFGKIPAELNGKEAAFLATLLPSPIRRHEQICAGTGFPSEKYAKKVDTVFGFMRSRKRIDEETYLIDRDTPLQFSLDSYVGEARCKDEGRRLLNAKGIQWAERGLLAGRSDKGTEEVTVEDVDVDALLEEME